MKVAVLGYGVVGVGVCEMIEKTGGLELGKVFVRAGKADKTFKTESLEEILSDKSIETVCEVMGGVEPAFSYVAKALQAGKNVVTSNKALVSEKGPELAKLAKENDVAFLFSAACGGGVPFLHNLALAGESDTISSVGGILNGTTNFMLDAMQRKGMTYEEALKEAQNLGYAEADPTADVSGLDALRKIMLACAVAYDKLPSEGLLNEGIESFTDEDVRYLKSKGLVCRLITSGGLGENGELYANVEPVLFKETAAECSVLENYNLAKYKAESAGPMVFIGQGAGRFPTASAVLRDLCDIRSGRKTMMKDSCVKVCADNSVCRHAYLVRSEIAPEISVAAKEEAEGNTYYMTEAVSVKEMHEMIKKFRSKGAKVFFAAIGE